MNVGCCLDGNELCEVVLCGDRQAKIYITMRSNGTVLLGTSKNRSTHWSRRVRLSQAVVWPHASLKTIECKTTIIIIIPYTNQATNH